MSWLDSNWKNLLLSGGSALAGGLANRASSSMPKLSPEYQPLQSDLLDTIRKRMADPAAGTEPLRLGLMESVNRAYSALPRKVGTQLASRGFGQSGQTGAALKGVELGRMGAQGDVNTEIARLILGREDSALELANRMLAQGRGQEQSGNVAGGAVSKGISALTALDVIDKMSKATQASAAAAGGAIPLATAASDVAAPAVTYAPAVPAMAGATGAALTAADLPLSTLPSAGFDWASTFPGLSDAVGEGGAGAGAGAGGALSVLGPIAGAAAFGAGAYDVGKTLYNGITGQNFKAVDAQNQAYQNWAEAPLSEGRPVYGKQQADGTFVPDPSSGWFYHQQGDGKFVAVRQNAPVTDAWDETGTDLGLTWQQRGDAWVAVGRDGAQYEKVPGTMGTWRRV